MGNIASCDLYMRIDKEFYISHIQGEAFIFKMKQILDNVEIVLNNHRLESTDFLDPYERYLARSILNRFEDIKYLEDGGLEDSERKSLSIYPFYFQEEDIEDKISFLKIQFPSVHLKHKDFLGAILNLGIAREKLGDFYIHNGHTFIAVKNEIKDYLLYNLIKVSNYVVKVMEVEREDLEATEDKYKEINKFVSSLRLDTVISAIYNLSRQNSLKLIQSEKVKINFKPIEKASIELNEGDLLSVKGYGRSIFQSINGTSKKGNFNITIRIII